MGRLLVILGFLLIVIVVVALVAYFALVPPASRWQPPLWARTLFKFSVILLVTLGLALAVTLTIAGSDLF